MTTSQSRKINCEKSISHMGPHSNKHQWSNARSDTQIKTRRCAKWIVQQRKSSRIQTVTVRYGHSHLFWVSKQVKNTMSRHNEDRESGSLLIDAQHMFLFSPKIHQSKLVNEPCHAIVRKKEIEGGKWSAGQHKLLPVACVCNSMRRHWTNSVCSFQGDIAWVWPRYWSNAYLLVVVSQWVGNLHANPDKHAAKRFGIHKMQICDWHTLKNRELSPTD